jgi:uncharacterized protein YcbK (DUF882 family)
MRGRDAAGETPVNRQRRTLITGGLAAFTLLAARPAFAVVATPPVTTAPRLLKFQNLHTGESCKAEYWCDGQYLPDGLSEIARVLRDHRSGDVHPIDQKLLDTLVLLQDRLGMTTAPFQVISGYRSPASNAKLAAASSGVAKHSLHMDAKAIDIRVPGIELTHVRDAARELKAGGVGFYAASNFVHVDTGRVRFW